MNTGLRWRRILGWLTPAFGRTRCSHCHVPWGNGSRDPQPIGYRPGRFVFCLCQWCWPRTTPDQRMEYAEEVFADREYWPEIRAAVASER